ncbi:hypothetical protein HAX54_043941 [Datura stramonium]|uniref:SNF2 N-terminal domain-containing protein n=1 Tax=Datura stramonium TaxID=4076 RepID=A0ABS8W1T1_DATST|nr:hypothetical protein [Datura stramonium]
MLEGRDPVELFMRLDRWPLSPPELEEERTTIHIRSIRGHELFQRWLIQETDTNFLVKFTSLQEAEIVKEKRSTPEGRDIDEIFKLLDDKVSKKEELKALEPPKNIIKSKLLLHQKEGLWWLVQREKSEELPPFWEEKEGNYVNVLTNYSTDKRPEPIRGGIFADDMGLGKTLTLLSLIALDKCGGGVSSIKVGI